MEILFIIIILIFIVIIIGLGINIKNLQNIVKDYETKQGDKDKQEIEKNEEIIKIKKSLKDKCFDSDCIVDNIIDIYGYSELQKYSNEILTNNLSDYTQNLLKYCSCENSKKDFNDKLSSTLSKMCLDSQTLRPDNKKIDKVKSEILKLSGIEQDEFYKFLMGTGHFSQGTRDKINQILNDNSCLII